MARIARASATLTDISDGDHGLSTAILELYQRNSSGTAPSGPSQNTIFSYDTNTLAPADNNGWTREIPDIADGRYLWVVTITISSDANIVNIPSSAWNAPVVDSFSPPDAFQNATVSIYIRSTSTPTSRPTVNATYDFTTATTSFGGSSTSNGWSTSIPTGSNDLYVRQVNIATQETTYTIIPNAWGNVAPLSEAPADPDLPINAATVYLHKRTNTAATPAGPNLSDTYTFATGALGRSTNNGWTRDVPDSGGNYLWQVQVRVQSTAASISVASSSWSTASLLNVNGVNAPRSTQRVVYRGPQLDMPSAPSANSINFNNGSISNLTSNWALQLPTVGVIGTNDIYWQSTLTFTEASLGGSQTVVSTAPTPVQVYGTDIASDNFVSGESGWRLERDTGNAEIEDAVIRGSFSTGNLVVNSSYTPTSGEGLIAESGNFVTGNVASNISFVPGSGLVITGGVAQNLNSDAPGLATMILGADFPSGPQHGQLFINTTDNSFNVFDANRNGWTGFQGTFTLAPSTIVESVYRTTGGFVFGASSDWDVAEIWFSGGGGSGGAASTNSGREKVASGGGAGGVGGMIVPSSNFTGIFLASGAGGQAVSASGSGQARSGYDGGSSSINVIRPEGDNLIINAAGGTRGFGSRQTSTVGEGTTSTSIGAWGTCDPSTGGIAIAESIGEVYTGGFGPGFSIGGDGSAASGGGAPNFGRNEFVDDLNGPTISGSGFRSGERATPALPAGFSEVTTALMRGGNGVQDSNGGSAITAGSGEGFGAGGGGAAGESQSSTSGAGARGEMIVMFRKFI